MQLAALALLVAVWAWLLPALHADDFAIDFPLSEFLRAPRFELRDGDVESESLGEIDASPAQVYYPNLASDGSTHRAKMPGEFEYQSALMIAGGALCRSAPSVLADLAEATDGYVPLMILVNDTSERESVQTQLPPRSRGGSHFAIVPHDTVWARDYGPTVLQGDLPFVVDAAYTDLDRSRDDQVPAAIAKLARLKTRHTELSLPGGNLLSNGRGLYITTTRIQAENPGKTQWELAQSIVEDYGAKTLAILEPLEGEGTGHVDMFATFTDESTIVVGRYDNHDDPENAKLLDHNARLLAELRVGKDKLRVVRIPMPARQDGFWPTFTNVVYANGRLLVPTYESTSEQQRKVIGNIYNELLPSWEIHFIRVDDLICSGGALHCVVSNLGPLDVVGGQTAYRQSAPPLPVTTLLRVRHLQQRSRHRHFLTQ